MLWFGLLALAIGGLAVAAGVYRWASSDPEIDREDAKEQFQAQQDWRALRRAGK